MQRISVALVTLSFAWAMQVALAHAQSASMVPTAVVSAPQPTAATLPPAGEGRRLFLKLNCYGCHGMRAQGGMGPNIVQAEKGDVSEVLHQGGDTGMPSYSKYVTATDITNITAYLASIGSKSEPTFTHWWETFPTQ